MENFIYTLIAVVVGILTLVGLLAPLLRPLIALIKDARIRQIAEEWVAYAEQISQAGVKKGEPPMAGALKFKVAAEGLQQATGISDARAQVLIESVLGAAKVNGTK